MDLKLQIQASEWRTQERFAEAASIPETRLSKIVRCLVEPTEEEAARISELLKSRMDKDFMQEIRDLYLKPTGVSRRAQASGTLHLVVLSLATVELLEEIVSEVKALRADLQGSE